VSVDPSIPRQVWKRYRYMTIYAVFVSTGLLLLEVLT
jgi:hypothetical protein